MAALSWETCTHWARKAGTQHAPATRSLSKAPSSAPTISSEKYVAQQNFCSRVLLPHIKLVWYEGASSRGKTVARILFQEQAPSCVLKFSLRERVPSCVLVGVHTQEHVSGACFRSKLLRVYWLEYLAGSAFRERVSGASSLVCTGLKLSGSVFRERVSGASSLVCTGFFIMEADESDEYLKNRLGPTKSKVFQHF